VFRKALLGLLIATAALVAVEGGLRLALPADRLLFEWERPTGLVALGEDGGIVTGPGMHDARQDGPYTWNIRINERGFREDAEVPTAKPAGVYRVLALGDSWIFGFSADQGHTIPDDLEAILPTRLGVERVEVINAGVFGSCAFDMLARYRQLVDTYEIDGVLLGQPHNSRGQERAADRRATWYRTAREGPASHARLYLLLRRALAPLRTSTYAVPPTGTALDEAIADLHTLAADAHTRGLPVWFAELPSNLPQAMNGFAGDPTWRAALGPDGVLFGGHALGERACWGFTDLGHPSAAGAAVIADALAEVIATHTSLPAIRTTPRCADGDTVGPTKPGWAWSQ
jgi:lysophospholipase L1-like esterase